MQPDLTDDSTSLNRSQQLVEAGLAELDLAEFESAIELFSEAAIANSANSRAWFYLGLCYLETRRADLAQEALNRAIAADPHYADAHYLLGTTMGAAGRIEDAAQCYRDALEVDPHHAKAEEFLMRTEALLASRSHYMAAMKLIYHKERELGWLNQAVRELLHSVAIFKDSPAISEFVGLATMVVESGATKSAGNSVGRGDPFWLKAITKAESAFARKNWPEAASAYNESLEFDSGHAFVRHALGLIYFALGDYESGISAWQKAFELDPDHDFSVIRRLSL